MSAAAGKCGNCGAEFQKATAKFCAKCGFKRKDGASAAAPPSAQAAPAAPAAKPPLSKPPQAQQAASSAPAAAPAPTSAPQPQPTPAQATTAADDAASPNASLGSTARPTPGASATVDVAEPASAVPERKKPFELLYDCLSEAQMLHAFAALEAAGMHDDALPFVEDEDLKAGGIEKPFERRRLLAKFQAATSSTRGSVPSRSAERATAAGGSTAEIDYSAKTLAPGEDSGLTPEALETANADDLRGYIRGTLLGRGTYGSVYMAMLPTGRFAAVKEIGLTMDKDGDGTGFKASDIINLSREITMMRRVRHDNVCEFFGCCWDAKEQRLSLFMELVTGGTLVSLVKRFHPLPPAVTRLWTKQLLVGLEFLHSNHIMHRDIKGENVLVDINSRTPLDACIKLADFGGAKRLTDVAANNRTVVGTPYFMAPEVVKSDDGYSYSADVWSLGCTVVEMHTGKPPWPAKSTVPAAILMIATSENGPSELPTAEKDNATPGCLDFLSKSFTMDPAKRPSAKELLAHPWITGDMP